MPPLPKNDKPIDITQIAQALGVSKTNVSRSISGNGRISAATRQRVLDYVKEHNYTSSMMARGLVKHCSYNISLVISMQFSDFELPFLRKVMRSVYQVAGDSDYDVLLTLVGENETRPVERLLDNRKIDGLILTRTLERDPLIPLLKARKVPFVAIGQPEDDQVLSVDHDQVGGCREMTSLLLMKGMKHIALLGGKGPDVRVKLAVSQKITCAVRGDFTESGINQTLHRVFLRVTVEVCALLPGAVQTFSVPTDVCVAETVIIGKVPEAYTRIDRFASDVTETEIDDISDYGAQGQLRNLP